MCILSPIQVTRIVNAQDQKQQAKDDLDAAMALPGA